MSDSQRLWPLRLLAVWPSSTATPVAARGQRCRLGLHRPSQELLELLPSISDSCSYVAIQNKTSRQSQRKKVVLVRPKILAQYSRNRFPSLLMLMLGGATHYTQLVDLHEWSCQHHNDNQIGVQDKMASIGAALSGLKNSSFTTMGAEKLPDQMHDLKIRDDNEVQVTNINGKGAETGHIIVTTTGGRNGQPKLTKCKSAWEDMLNTEHAVTF
ncbi:hypothetical protein OsI_35910 [Oryza sativa Indica Group]|nr:hypothetical protein OsI_35910 [Oryza sativa Indica Group]